MDRKQDQNTEKLKEIPKWTRKYAHNRMLTPFVLFLMPCLIGMVITVPILLIWLGFLRENMILAGIGIGLLIVVSIFYIMFFLKFCGKNRGLIDQIIDRRIYSKEGTASMPPPNITKKIRGLDYILGAIGLVYMLGANHLCMTGFISFKYLQPLLALYLVPAFMVEYFLIMRTKIGPLFLICPILYAAHAILILEGVPIFFTGNLGVLNMVVPLFGYSFLAFAIGHIYSRYALKKLKGLTHLEGGTANGD